MLAAGQVIVAEPVGGLGDAAHLVDAAVAFPLGMLARDQGQDRREQTELRHADGPAHRAMVAPEGPNVNEYLLVSDGCSNAARSGRSPGCEPPGAEHGDGVV